jgi:hypothetical protein
LAVDELPTATAFCALAVLLLPIAVAPVPDAVALKPYALLDVPDAVAKVPTAAALCDARVPSPIPTAPSPDAVANVPNNVTPLKPVEYPPPLALQPATFDQTPLPSTGLDVAGSERPSSEPAAALQVAVDPDPVKVDAYAADADTVRSRLTSSLTEVERLLLPRAESSSDAATQAPRASFQIERYVWFIFGYTCNAALLHKSSVMLE